MIVFIPYGRPTQHTKTMGGWEARGGGAVVKI